MVPTVLMVFFGVAALAVWNMPDALRWCAAHLLSRGEALEAQRATRAASLARYQREFSIPGGER